MNGIYKINDFIMSEEHFYKIFNSLEIFEKEAGENFMCSLCNATKDFFGDISLKRMERLLGPYKRGQLPPALIPEEGEGEGEGVGEGEGEGEEYEGEGQGGGREVDDHDHHGHDDDEHEGNIDRTGKERDDDQYDREQPSPSQHHDDGDQSEAHL